MLDGMPQVMWFIRRYMRQNRTRGLSVPAFRTLVLLDRYPQANLSLVADHLGASLPTASRMVAGLVRKGMVQRADSEADRRQVILKLTAKGRSAFAATKQETQKQIETKLRSLSPQERDTVTRAMSVLGDLFACGAASAAVSSS